MRKAVNIEWDVDDEKELADLPDEIEIPGWIKDLDEISAYISDITGFCHGGFELKNDGNAGEGSSTLGISDYVRVKSTGENVLITDKDELGYTVKDRAGNTMQTNGEELEVVEANYLIPVTWEMYGVIAISARSAEEALEKAKNSLDYLKLPDGEYVAASLQIADTENSHLHLYQR